MQVKAIHKNARITPKKANLVAGMIRGKDIMESLDVLKFMNKKAADIILKVLKSAMANADIKKIDKKTISISAITVGKGTVYKRWKPVSRGRAHAFQKKNSHITVELEGEVKEAKAKTIKKEVKKVEDKKVNEKKVEPAKTEEKKIEKK